MLAVLDIGKTHSRILVLDEEGRQHAAQTRVNRVQRMDRRQSLDVDAIEDWLLASLSALSRRFTIGSIIPVAHGATAALIENGKRAAPVLDYECAIPDDVAEAYDALRDPFMRTFSPRLRWASILVRSSSGRSGFIRNFGRAVRKRFYGRNTGPGSFAACMRLK